MPIYTWTGRPDRAAQITFPSGTVIAFGGYANLLASEITYMQNRGDTLAAGQVGASNNPVYDPNYDVITAARLSTALAGFSGSTPRRPSASIRPGHVPLTGLHYRMGTTNQIPGTSFTQGNTRAWFQFPIDASEVSFEIPNFYVGTTGEDDTYQIDPVTIRAEVECNGIVEPAVWLPGSGAKVGTVDALGNGAFWCPIRIPANTDAWIRLNYTITSGQKWLAVLALDDGTGAGANFTASDQSQGTGALPQNQSTLALGPAYVAGRIPDSTNQPSFAILGDSIEEGVSATETRSGVVIGLRQNNIGLINLSRTAEALNQFLSRAGSRRRRMLCRVSSVWYGYCFNDYNIGRTTAQLQADMITSWLDAASFSLPVWQRTHTPRSTSTDSWVTVANQTISSGGAANQQTLNAWLRDGAPILGGVAVAPGSNIGTAARAAVYSATGTLTTAASGPAHPIGKGGIVDYAAAVESALGSGLWRATGRSAVLNVTSGSTAATLVSGTIRPGDFLVSAALPALTVATGSSDITTPGAAVTLSQNASATNTTAAVNSAYTADGIHFGSSTNPLTIASLPIAAMRAATAS